MDNQSVEYTMEDLQVILSFPPSYSKQVYGKQYDALKSIANKARKEHLL